MKGPKTATPEPEVEDVIGAPAVKSSAGFKGLMGRLKSGKPSC